MKKVIIYLIQSILIYFLFIVGRILGLKISRIIFSNLFLLFGSYFKSKKIIRKNLDIFSQNNPNIDQKKIVKAMWRNYGMTFIEYIYLKHFYKKNSHIILEGNEIIAEIIKEQKPVIFISGHFANFELMSMEITKKNIPLATIYRPLNNFFLNPFMEYLRKKYVCKNQIKKGINGVRETINYINTNHSIALMGELSAETLKKRNIRGYIADGGCRDVTRIKNEIKFPVYCRFNTPKDIAGKWLTKSMGKKIYIENTPIDTGDYLIADEDGIVIIPKNIVRKIINKAKNDLNSEDKMRIAILNGENPKKAYLKYKKF